MVHQMAIYDQGCKLMVGAPFHVRVNGIISLHRTQVGVFSALSKKCLT